MFANYHTHTARCHHAVGEDREYVEAAIRSGMHILGFSDHCPWLFPEHYTSGTRMLPGSIDDYFESMERLKREYSGDITIYAGFESEFIPELMAAQTELLRQYPVDYMILGQHFLRPEPHGSYTGFPTQDESELELYVRLCMEAVTTGRYSYVAHPDLLNYTGPDEVYERHMRRLCEFFLSRKLPVEINMLGVLGGRHYPSERFLRIAGQVGNSAIIGVDAHSPDRLESHEGERLCRELAERYGLPLVEWLPGLGERKAD